MRLLSFFLSFLILTSVIQPAGKYSPFDIRDSVSLIDQAQDSVTISEAGINSFDSNCMDPCHIHACHIGHCFYMMSSNFYEFVGLDSSSTAPRSLIIAESPFLDGPRRPPRVSPA